jgi:hypothetical protein
VGSGWKRGVPREGDVPLDGASPAACTVSPSAPRDEERTRTPPESGECHAAVGGMQPRAASAAMVPVTSPENAE